MTRPEASHSGLVRSLGKRVGSNSPRRFKSCRLRRRVKRVCGGDAHLLRMQKEQGFEEVVDILT